jgi:DNA-binding GntR family transcriptional regulator
MSVREVVSGAGIDRASYEPAYAQLVRILSRQIAEGDYRPGDQLPSEAQLRAQFDVSAMTVRRAINILVDRGLVNAAQGKGCFVRGLDMAQASFRLEGGQDSWLSGAAAVRLLQASIVPADARVARKLGIEPGRRVIYIRRLVQHAGVPTMYHREHLIYDPRKPLVEDELQITSLEGLLDVHAGSGLRRADLTIEAVSLNPEEAELLAVPAGAPAFCLEHVFYDFRNTPVAWGWFICRGDRFHLRTRIGPDVG